MSDFILFPENDTIIFDYPIPLVLNAKLGEQLADMNYDKSIFLKEASKLKQLSVDFKNVNDGKFEFIIKNANFICKLISNEDYTESSLKITFCKQRKARNQNDLIKFGKRFLINKGIYFASGRQNIYHDSTEWDESELKRRFHKDIMTFMNREEVAPAEENDEFILDEELENILNCAEEYIKIEDELEQTRKANADDIPYLRANPGYSGQSEQKSFYHFIISSNIEHGLKENGFVKIRLSDDSYVYGSIASIEENDNELDIKVGFSEEFDKNLLKSSGYLSEHYTDILKKVRQEVIESIKAGKGNAKVLNRILGSQPLLPIPDERTHNWNYFNDGIKKKKYPPNESQLNAIKSGVLAEDAYLVLGPPGTGKTTVILEWAKYFVNYNQRLLISSQNNKAVDNVISRLKEENIDIIRVGNADKVQDDVKDLLFDNRIKDLQDKFIKDISYSSGSIEEYIEDLNNYRSILVESETWLEEEQELEGIIRELYSGLSVKHFKPMKELINSAERMKKNYYKTRIKLSKLKNKAEKKKGLIGRIIYFFTGRIHEKSIREMKKSLIDSRDKMKVMESLYKKCVDKVTVALDDSKLTNQKRLLTALRTKLSGAKVVIIQQSPRWEFKTQSFNFNILEQTTNLNILIPKSIRLVDEEIASSVYAFRAMQEFEEDTMNRKNYVLAEVLLESVDLVAGTCIGINSQRAFKNIDFDSVIIDESGQIQIHNAIVPMSRGKRIIMLGDHIQIPPIVDQDAVLRAVEKGVPTDLLRKSLFEDIFKRYPESNKTQLDTQYRMPGEIADLLAEFFYKNNYHSFAGKRNMESILPKKFNKPFVLVDTSYHLKRNETKIDNEGCVNELEADWIADLVGYIRKEKDIKEFKDSDIGIIAMYGKQVELIRKKLVSKLGMTEDEAKRTVASVDSFQGQERKIIIFSFVRSSNKAPKDKRIGFLKEMRRLNVAFSRPEEMLIAVGDYNFLKKCENVEKKPLESESKEYGVNEKDMGDFIKLLFKHVENGCAEHVKIEQLQFKTEVVS